ncbi:MAG: UDP-N-acetylmuramoyl-L-alanine--D-glutamate ligase [Anaerolineae bacterium]
MRGRRLLVVGLAREGTALAHYLSQQGAHVVATDLKPPRAFGDTLKPLMEAGVELVLGEHPPSLLKGCQIAFVSPGVPFDAPFLDEARAQGVPLSTESRLFCQLCPAPVAGITGSSGKTTTTTLVGEIIARTLQIAGDSRQAVQGDPATPPRPPKCWVGGNIGQPLIERLGEIQPQDRVVMELSSFQLEYFHPSANEHVSDCDPMWLPLLAGWSPAVGAILNITPNHLDRHPSMQAYIHAKRAIIAYRKPGDVAILGLDNQVTKAIGQTSAGRVRWFTDGGCQDLPEEGGACLSGEGPQATIVLRGSPDGQEHRVCQVGDIQLRGRHNVSNVLAACAIADTLGAPVEAIREVVTTFSGVEHRLELVGEINGVRYYNDSIATSPERLVAALRSFDEPIILLAGGRDKHLPWDEAARLILERTRHVILFGEAVELIAGAIEKEKQTTGGPQPQPDKWPMLHRCVTLEDAVAVAAQVARPHQVVLLSPGCTSFDAFRDFAERGRQFRELVGSLAKRATT